MLWSMEMSGHWVEIDPDHDVWLTLPSVFPLDRWQDDLSWAMDHAEAVWAATGRPYRRRHVKQMVKSLIQARAHMAQRASWSHLSFLHLPDPMDRPMFLSVGVWRAQGEPDEMLRFYTCADLPRTLEPPEVEEFATEHLGTGLRVLTGLASEPDSGVLGYAWRVEDHTDLCLTVLGDKERLPEIRPDVDAFAKTIRVVPEPDGEPDGPDGPDELDGEDKEDGEEGELVLEATSLLQVIGWVEKSLSEIAETDAEDATAQGDPGKA
jgi:hypothetical protein